MTQHRQAPPTRLFILPWDSELPWDDDPRSRDTSDDPGWSSGHPGADTTIDVDDPYVEAFWLPLLGPSATWLIRRLIHELRDRPAGFELDLDATAKALGLRYSRHESTPFVRSIERCVRFGLAREVHADVLEVVTRMPVLVPGRIQRLPAAARAAHAAWETGRAAALSSTAGGTR
ncbi:MAG: hypothetical protein R2705_05935 [Ilumatobacteraceae bacterium]